MQLELVILVGLQGAGKSTYARDRFAATHVQVSKDLMKNSSHNAGHKEMRQRQMIGDALSAGRSVVADNTNPTPAVRQPLIELGRRHGARIVGVYFEATVKDAVTRNRSREGKERVPDVAIFMTARRLVPPSFGEGFDEIRVIAPLPGLDA